MSRMRHFIAERLPLWARMGGRRVLYWGTAKTCDLCGSHVRTYLQNGIDIPVLHARRVVGGMPRAQDRCPVCHALDRTRMIQTYLQKTTSIETSPVSVLHFAPDLGLVLWLKTLPHIDYTGTDLSAKRYRHVPNFTRADITQLPFGDARFDIVICSHVLEHVPDDAAAMAELYRVTKPGGRVLALAPLATDDLPTEEDPAIDDPAEQERRFGQWDHVRLYHRDDFVARLGAAGFDVTLWSPFEAEPELAKERHMNPAELLPVCTKP